jgi:hypothetical protein
METTVKMANTVYGAGFFDQRKDKNVGFGNQGKKPPLDYFLNPTK